MQECLRVRARQGHQVDCYVCLEQHDRDYGNVYQGLLDLQEFGYYIRSIEQSDLAGEVIATEQQVKFQYLLQKYLTSQQEHRMVQLVERYPALLTERHLTIDTAELGRLWHCRSGDVCDVLASITKRSQDAIAYRILEPGQRGKQSQVVASFRCRRTAAY